MLSVLVQEDVGLFRDNSLAMARLLLEFALVYHKMPPLQRKVSNSHCWPCLRLDQLLNHQKGANVTIIQQSLLACLLADSQDIAD